MNWDVAICWISKKITMFLLGRDCFGIRPLDETLAPNSSVEKSLGCERNLPLFVRGVFVRMSRWGHRLTDIQKVLHTSPQAQEDTSSEGSRIWSCWTWLVLKNVKGLAIFIVDGNVIWWFRLVVTVYLCLLLCL